MASFAEVKQWVEKHPYETGGIVFGVGVVLILLIYSGSSSSTAAQSTTPATDTSGAASYDSYLASELQAEEASGAENASLTALQDQLQVQTASINAAVSVAGLNDTTDLQLASLNAQTTQDSINVLGGVQSLGILSSTETTLANIGANASVAMSQIASTDYQASLSAFTNVTDNYLAANTQQDLINVTAGEQEGEADLNNQLENLLASKIPG